MSRRDFLAPASTITIWLMLPLAHSALANLIASMNNSLNVNLKISYCPVAV